MTKVNNIGSKIVIGIVVIGIISIIATKNNIQNDVEASESINIPNETYNNSIDNNIQNESELERAAKRESYKLDLELEEAIKIEKENIRQEEVHEQTQQSK